MTDADAAPRTFVRADSDAALTVFTTGRKAPTPTFPLAVIGVTVAVTSMHLDAVTRYSDSAFWLGVFASLALAVAIGKTLGGFRSAAGRTAAALLLPTLGGAIIGVLIQGVVYHAVHGYEPVRDLGGLVDTESLGPWMLAGVVLGGLPALVVAAFLALAARALRKLAGHDAPEAFAVGFTGVAGVLAAFALSVVDPRESGPLIVATAASACWLLVALLVDGARLRVLREAFRGTGAYDIVPAARFAQDPTLAPVVAQAGAASVLVKVDRLGSYRNAAATPVALVADSERATTRPLLRRRTAAAVMLVSMTGLAALAAFAQGAV